MLFTKITMIIPIQVEFYCLLINISMLLLIIFNYYIVILYYLLYNYEDDDIGDE